MTRAIARLVLVALVLPASVVFAQGKKKAPPKSQPKVLVALPFGVKPGATEKVTLRGLKLDSAKEVRVIPKGTAKLVRKGKSPVPPQMDAGKVGDSEVVVELTVPADVPGASVELIVSGPGGDSAPHRVLLDRVPIAAEKEPNDGFKQAQPVALGQIVQGTISRPTDVDSYRFEGKAGQKVVLEVHAARYGSPLDSVLTLYGNSGATIEASDDIAGSTDSRIETTLPRTGTYYVVVGDANDQGAATFLYRLTLAAATTGVRATAVANPKPSHTDVSYGPHPNQRFDIYLPSKGKGPYPVLLWFGGIWKPGRHPARPDYFGNAGCAVIAVQTRTMTDAVTDKVYPPISYVAGDACRVVQFVRLHAAKWNLDPRRIAVGGGSQGALPALYVACAADQANPRFSDPVERVSSRVSCAAAYRSQPTIDPRRMQEWVPGVEWGAPALGYSFKESLKRRDELWPVIAKWSPDALLHKGTPPIYFENNWGLARTDGVGETDYKVHSPAWALGFQKLAHKASVECHVKYPGHPTKKYKDIWDFIVQELKAAPSGE